MRRFKEATKTRLGVLQKPFHALARRQFALELSLPQVPQPSNHHADQGHERERDRLTALDKHIPAGLPGNRQEQRIQREGEESGDQAGPQSKKPCRRYHRNCDQHADASPEMAVERDVSQGVYAYCQEGESCSGGL